MTRVSISDGPLTGTTVVSLEQAKSAPLCSRTLGDLGARVVKVECPRIGERRHRDEVVYDCAPGLMYEDRGKESVALDPRTDSGMAVLHQLFAKADVLVSDYDLGTLGVTSDDLANHCPDLIVVQVAGYGQDGPPQGKGPDELHGEAGSRTRPTNGQLGTPADTIPAMAGLPLAGAVGGLYAALSIVALLYEREALRGRGSRSGCSVAVNLVNAMTELMGHVSSPPHHGEVGELSSGRSRATEDPYGAYPTADGQTVVLHVVDDSEWQCLARDVLRRPELADDDRFRTNQARKQHPEALDAELRACCAGTELAHLQQRADAAGVGSAGPQRCEDTVGHGPVAKRQHWRRIYAPTAAVAAALPPVEIAGYEPPRGAIPSFGEHTASVLAELGHDTEQIARLREYGVIDPGR